MLPQIFAVVTFFAVFAIMVGLYWVAVVREEETEIDRLRSRVDAGVPTLAAPARSTLVRPDSPLSAIASLDALLARAEPLLTPLRTLLERSRVRTTVGAVLMMSGTLLFAAFGLTVWMTGSAMLGLLLGLCAGMIPVLIIRWVHRRLLKKFEEQLPESMDLLARSLRAGHAFSTGLKLAGEELPDPIGAEFRTLHDRHSFGQPMPQALREFAERVELIDARFFATAVLTQREAGGNLAEVLDHLASVVRDRFRVRREVQTKSAHGRLSGLVIAAMPPVLFMFMWFTSPDRIENFIREPMGIRMLIGAVISQVIGTAIISRIVKIRY